MSSAHWLSWVWHCLILEICPGNWMFLIFGPGWEISVHNKKVTYSHCWTETNRPHRESDTCCVDRKNTINNISLLGLEHQDKKQKWRIILIMSRKTKTKTQSQRRNVLCCWRLDGGTLPPDQLGWRHLPPCPAPSIMNTGIVFLLFKLAEVK